MRHFILVCKYMKNEYVKNTISIYSSNVVFFIMLSFFPFALFFMTLLKYTPITQDYLFSLIQVIIPGQIGDTLGSWIQEAYQHTSGTILSISALMTLWAGSKGFMGITYGLDKIYQAEKKRTWIFNRISSFLYTLAFAAILIISLIVIVFGNQILLMIDSFFSINIPLFIGIFSLRSIVGFAIFLCFFVLLYTFVPHHEGRPHIKKHLSGALFTAITWILFSYLYSIYIDSFSNFSTLYGSFTSISLLMLWLYVCINLLFIGAMINEFHAKGHRIFSPKAQKKLKSQLETWKESIHSENNNS